MPSRSLKAPVPEDQVARFLQQKATQLDSRMLSALAVRVAADPLAKARDGERGRADGGDAGLR